ncbi:adenylate/guanylate cyclase domain-containing protein [Mycolicibacterium palauense]|uniref:adenylate/guanylate cyclase domain-containing protein n=1 Tax=Mycolicibacterium palauense TaxID=2034511 RepID=UPI000BFF07A3|nr:adenylate/guanylate cyclase domain-containing protein [Mycolicibacterium palauense]
MADPEIEATGLLEGLEGSARAERSELIGWLVERGVAVEQIRASFSPMLLAARRLIGDDGTYVSTRDIAAKTGMDLELVQRLQRAMGLPAVDDPDSAAYLRADGEALGHIARFVSLGFDAEHLLQVTRSLADGLSRAAETMRYAALATVLRPGATELDIARDTRQLVAEAAPLVGPMVEDLLFLQLRHAMETEAVNATERAEGVPMPGARRIAVGFADLVGFTRLGEQTQPEELERLATHLAELARDVAKPPVRLVKTIGDAVMLVSADPVPLLEAMLDLVEATSADESLPGVRAGMAFGEAVSRAGDWFGSPVNQASRVTGIARPGSLLLAESAREEIGEVEGFRWSFAGARHLKGVPGETKLFRARREGD